MNQGLNEVRYSKKEICQIYTIIGFIIFFKLDKIPNHEFKLLVEVI